MILAAGTKIHGHVALEVADMVLHEALFLHRSDEILLQTVYDPDRSICRIYSHLRDTDIEDWVLRAQGIIRKCMVNGSM